MTLPSVSILLGDGVRLGNKLYMHACVHAWCLEEGLTFIDPAFYPYARHFARLRGNLLASPHHELRLGTFLADRCRVGRGVWWTMRGMGKLGLLGRPMSPGRDDEAPRYLPPSGPSTAGQGKRWTVIRWGLANPRGMLKHRSAILEALEPLPEIVDDARRFAAELPADRLCIAVHVRHTDFRERLGGHLFIPLERTLEAMAQLRSALAPVEPLFVIFSDEKREAKEFPGFDTVISRGSVIQDLHRMGTLPLVIGPLSSFSLWSAYHGGGLAWHLTGRPQGLELYGWFVRGMPSVTRVEGAAAWLRMLSAAGRAGARQNRWDSSEAYALALEPMFQYQA